MDYKKYINQDFLTMKGKLLFCLSIREVMPDSRYGTELIFYDPEVNKIYTTRISRSKIEIGYKWLNTKKIQNEAYHKMITTVFNNPDGFEISFVKGYIYASKL